MTPKLGYLVPVEKMDYVRSNLSEAWGYVMALCDKGEIPSYAQDPLKEYLKTAYNELTGLKLVRRRLYD